LVPLVLVLLVLVLFVLLFLLGSVDLTQNPTADIDDVGCVFAERKDFARLTTRDVKEAWCQGLAWAFRLA
jgi:hypothetical protein